MYTKLLIDSGYYDLESLQPFSNQALKYGGILNLSPDELMKYTGIDYMKELFRRDTYNLLKSYVRETGPSKKLIYATYLINRNMMN